MTVSPLLAGLLAAGTFWLGFLSRPEPEPPLRPVSLPVCGGWGDSTQRPR